MYDLENSHMCENIFKLYFCFSMRKAINERGEERKRERERLIKPLNVGICLGEYMGI